MLQDFDAELTCALRGVELPEGWSLLQQEGEELQRERETERERDRWDTCMTACLRKGAVHAVSVKGRSYYIYL